jgi:hypothetical protein
MIRGVIKVAVVIASESVLVTSGRARIVHATIDRVKIGRVKIGRAKIGRAKIDLTQPRPARRERPRGCRFVCRGAKHMVRTRVGLLR